MATSVDIYKKLDMLEDEITSLKQMVFQSLESEKKKKNINLKGLYKGISLSEEDIEEAKRSLFKVGA